MLCQPVFADQSIGIVQHLHSLSHVPHIVSQTNTIRMAWDPPEIGEDQLTGYYYLFSTQSDFEFTLENTYATNVTYVKTGMAREAMQSFSNLDDVGYFFHIAPANENAEIIGQTETFGPMRIDTVPPNPVHVSIPEFSSSPNIFITLGAYHAIDMNISDLAYGGGDWEPLANFRPWTLRSTDGSHMIYVQFRDQAGNISNASVATTLDTKPPAMRFDSPISTAKTNQSPIPITLVSNEPVRGFIMSDLILVNATATPLYDSEDIPEYHDSFAFLVFPISQGPIMVTLPENSIQDHAGHSNTLPTSFTSQFDTIKPIGTIQCTLSQPTAQSMIPFTLTFNEPVHTFEQQNLSVSGAIQYTLTPIGIGPLFTQFSILAIPESDLGTIMMTVPETITTDEAGNHNRASQPFTLTFDSRRPTVQIITAPLVQASDIPIAVTVIFSEPVIGFDSHDVTTENAQMSDFSDANQTFQTQFTFAITPENPGALTLTIKEAVAADIAGNINIGIAEPVCLTFLGTYPTVYLTTVSSFVIDTTPIIIKAIFNQPITGFTRSDLIYTNCEISNLTSIGESLMISQYQFIVTPLAQGELTIRVPSQVVTNALNQSNAGSPMFKRWVDTNDIPQISMISSLVIDEDTQSPVIPINISDADGGPLTLSIQVTNHILIPDQPGHLTLCIHDVCSQTLSQHLSVEKNQTLPVYLTIHPDANQAGVSDIIVFLQDPHTNISKSLKLTVTQINDPPIIDLSQTSLTYQEKELPKPIDSSATVSDSDSLTFIGSTLVVSTTLAHSGHQLAVINQGFLAGQIGVVGDVIRYGNNDFATFIGGYGGTPLEISFTSNFANLSAMTALIRQISYANYADNHPITPFQIAFYLTEDDGMGYTAYKSVQMTGVNTNPNVIISNEAVIYIENQPPGKLFESGTVTDSDETDFGGGIMQVSFVTGAEITDYLDINRSKTSGMAYAIGNNIYYNNIIIATVTTGTSTSPLVISLNTSASQAGVTAILQGITFIAQSNTPSQTDRVVKLDITDGDGGSSTTVFRTIRVLSSNDPPSIQAPFEQEITEDNVLTFKDQRIIFISDPDVGEYPLLINLSASHGTLTLKTTSGLSFVEGNGSSNAKMSFTANLTRMNAALNGMTYTPNPDYSGTDTIQIEVNDHGYAGFQSSVGSDSRSIPLFVLPVNDSPELSIPKDQTTLEDTAVSIGFILTDMDMDQITLQVAASKTSLVSNNGFSFQCQGKTISGNVASLTATNRVVPFTLTILPQYNQFGKTKLTLTATDPDGASDGVIFELTIQSVNDSPRISIIQTITLNEDTPTDPIPFTVSDPETTDAELITVQAVSSNPLLLQNDHIILSGTGTYRTMTLTPASNQHGALTITITAKDPEGNPGIYSIPVTIQPVNDPPNFSNIDPVSILEDTAVSVPFTVSDVDGDQVTIYFISTNSIVVPENQISLTGPVISAQNGVYTVSTAPAGYVNMSARITPAPNENGQADILIVVTDQYNQRAVNRFKLTVLSVNDAPTISSIAPQVTLEDTMTEAIPFTVTDADKTIYELLIIAESSNETLISPDSIVIDGVGEGRRVTINPEKDQFGEAMITLTVKDPGAITASTSFFIKVNSVNDPPMISPIKNQITSLNIPLKSFEFSISDVETPTDQLILSSESSLPELDISFEGTGNTRIATLSTPESYTGTAFIKFIVTDQSTPTPLTSAASFQLIITDYNDPPTIMPVASQVILEDTSLAPVIVRIDDAQTLPGQLIMSATSSNGILVPDHHIIFGGSGSIRTVSLTPDISQTGQAQITLRVTDEGGLYAETLFMLTVSPVNDPPLIARLSPINGGDRYSVARTIGGSVYAWGSNQYGILGQLPTQTPQSAHPLLISGLPVIQSIVSGEQHALALDIDHMIWSWGANTFGQLGTGESATLMYTPVRIQGINDIVQIAAGKYHSLALKTDGTVLSWGRNDVGQLGDLTGLLQISPVQVRGPEGMGRLTQIIAIDAGDSHSVALSSDGTVWSWGNNAYGQLGNGKFINCPSPVKVVLFGNNPLTDIVAIAARENRSLALKKDGTVWAWGSNLFGQLGNGESGPGTDKPYAIQVKGISQIIAIAVGDTHSMALTKDGRIWAWGANTNGRLGDGTSILRKTPVLVKNELATNTLTNINAIAAGDNHSMALRNDGIVLAWGKNDSGQLGDGSTSDRFVPIHCQYIDKTDMTLFRLQEDQPTIPMLFVMQDLETPPNDLLLKNTTSHEDIVSLGQMMMNVFGQMRTMSIVPEPDAFGTVSITMTLSDSGNLTARHQFSIEIMPINDAPTIAQIGNQATDENTPLNPITIIIDDKETDANELNLAVQSSDTMIIPQSNMTLSGIGNERTLNITPAQGMNGEVTITVIVSDPEGLTQSTTFNVIVNDQPDISYIAPKQTNEDTISQPIIFTISDAESNPCAFTPLIQSSNEALIPNSSIHVTCFQGEYQITLMPEPNQNGFSLITIFVSDGAADHSRTFTMTVTPVNDPPVITMTDNPVDYTENSIILYNSNCSVSDIDSPDFFNGELLVSFDTGGTANDRLTIRNQGNQLNQISVYQEKNIFYGATYIGSFSGGNSLLTPLRILLAPGSTSQAVAALIENLQYENTSDFPQGTTRIIEIVLTDGDGDQVSQSFYRTIQMIPINDPPILYYHEQPLSAVPLLPNIKEESLILFNAAYDNRLYIQDPDCANLPIALTLTAQLGTLTLNAAHILDLSSVNGDKSSHVQMIGSMSAINQALDNLTYRALKDHRGSETITFTVNDLGHTGQGDEQIQENALHFQIENENDAPIIDVAANYATIDAIPVSFPVALTDVDGDNLVIWAISSNPDIITQTNIVFSGEAVIGQQDHNFMISMSGRMNRSITCTVMPIGHRHGTSQITFWVRDPSLLLDSALTTIQVDYRNDAPYFSPIANQAIVSEVARPFYISITQISDQDGNTQSLSFTTSSSNPAIIPDPVINFTHGTDSAELVYTPVAFSKGKVTITITLYDDGGTDNNGNDELQRQFTIDVTPLNYPPTINAIPDQLEVLEDSNIQSVILDGVTDGNNNTQSIQLSVESSNPTIIPTPIISYNSPAPVGILYYSVVKNQSGPVTITVTVKDNGGTFGNGIDTTTESFLVNVLPVNDAPTINPITDLLTIPMNAGPQRITLTGITDGDHNTQSLMVHAIASDLSIISSIDVIYSSPESSALLVYTPVTNASGTCYITITVTDNGGTEHNGVNSTRISFMTQINWINLPPMINQISDPAPIFEDAGQQIIIMSGITDGNQNTQNLTFTAKSSNQLIVPNPSIIYEQQSESGKLIYMPVANASGTVNITVTIQDDGGKANGGNDTSQFMFYVRIFPINDAPTMDPVQPIILTESPGLQTITLTGITDGDDGSQQLIISAISSNVGIIPHPTVSYQWPNQFALLRFEPIEGANGTAYFSIKIEDDGGIANNGVDTYEVQFPIKVQDIFYAPEAYDGHITGLEDHPITGTCKAFDLDGDALTFILIADAQKGSVTFTDRRAGDFLYTPHLDQSGNDSFTFKVNDGEYDSNTAQITVYITPVNDPPIIHISQSDITYTETNDPVLIVPDATINDVDTSYFIGGQLTIDFSDVNTAYDRLQIIPKPDILVLDGNQILINGVITAQFSGGLNGSSPLIVSLKQNTDIPAIQTILRQVAYFNSSINPLFQPRIVRILLTDNDNGRSEPVFKTIQVVAKNDAPILSYNGTPVTEPLQITDIPEDQIMTFDQSNNRLIQVNDSDVDMALMTLTMSATLGYFQINDESASNVTITTNMQSLNQALSQFSYHTYPNINGQENMVITVNDNGHTGVGGPLSSSMILRFKVLPVNDVPEMTSIANQETMEDTAFSVGFVLTDIDADPLTLSLTVANPTLISGKNITILGDAILDCANQVCGIKASSGPIQISVFITPDMNQYGQTQIDMTVSDSKAWVNRSFQVQVFPVNDKPVMINIPDQTISEDNAFTPIPLINYATDIEDTPSQLIWDIKGQSQLQVTINEQEVIIQAQDNWFGSETILFTVFDSEGLSATDSAKFTVLPVNDPPVISAIEDITTLWGLSVPEISFQVSDIDDPTLWVSITSSNSNVVPEDNAHLSIQSMGLNYTIQTTQGQTVTLPLSITPIPGSKGASTIMISVSDNNQRVAYSSFVFSYMPLTINAIAGMNGKIIPDGALDLNYAEPYVQYKMQPNTGFLVKDVIIDGQPKGPVTNYTFWNIIENHSINVTFREAKSYSIVATVGEGGIIEPSNVISVFEASSKTFKITPHPKYEIKQVTVDGKPVGPLSSVVFSSINASHTISATFSPITPPTVSFIATPLSGKVPHTVQFSDQSTGKITSWLWEFGDNDQSVLQNPVHTYNAQGVYSVRLKVIGPGGEASKLAENLVYVSHVPLSVNMIADKVEGLPPLTVSFQSKTQGTISDYLWQFGDGAESTSKSPVHTYTQTGNYTVTLTVSGESGSQTQTKTNFIHVFGRQIMGRVTALDQTYPNNGLNGYTVEAWLDDTFLAGQTQTDETGYYTLTQLPVSDHLIVSAWPPLGNAAYDPQYYFNQTSRDTATNVSVMNGNQTNINFALNPASILGIKGKVLDINGIDRIYSVEAFSETLLFSRSVLTNAQGEYEITGLKASNDYIVSVWSAKENVEFFYAIPKGQTPGVFMPQSSAVSWNMATKISPSSPILDNIDLIVSQTGTISGHVTVDNKPVAGIFVKAWSDVLNNGNGATTNALGDYTITGLLATSDQTSVTYIVEIQSDHYPYQAYDNQINRDLATPVTTGMSEINFSLQSSAYIAGVVVDENNLPVNGVCVRGWSYTTGKSVLTTTNAYGAYTLTALLPSKDYIVAVFPLGYPAQYYPEKLKESEAKRIDLTHGVQTAIHFKLIQMGIIQGVIFQETFDTPFPAGIWVNVWSESTLTGGDVATNHQGIYRITGLLTTASDYIISVRQPGYMPAFYHPDAENQTVYQWDQAMGVKPSDETRNLLLIKGFTVSGKITYEGKYVSGVRVEAFSESTGGWGSAVSQSQPDGQGNNFTLSGLTQGIYEISTQSDAFADASRSEFVYNHVQDCHFELKRPERFISGTITGLTQGVEVWMHAWSEKAHVAKTVQVTSKGQSVGYTINSLKAANDYHVEFRATGYPYLVYNQKQDIQFATPIDLSETDQSNIDFQTSPIVQTTIAGNVIFPPGALKGDTVWVDAFSYESGSGKGVNVILPTNVEGHSFNVPYSLTKLMPATDYVVMVWSDKYQIEYYQNASNRVSATLVNTTDATPDDTINFQLSAGAWISGRIINDLDLGLPGISVEAWSQKTDVYGSTLTKQDGSFIIYGLEYADDYIIEARKPGAGAFYYHPDETMRYRAYAAPVSTRQSNPDDIQIVISEGVSIRGTIYNISGQAISGLWVIAWSESRHAGNGAYTDPDGQYTLKGLPYAEDYKISVQPHWTMPYIPQEKYQVTGGATHVDFILSTGFQLSGYVNQVSGDPIAGVEVEIFSTSLSFYAWAQTDEHGNYTIKGIPSGNDFVILTTPSAKAAYISFREKGLRINSHITKNITLQSALSIEGTVYVQYTDEFQNTPYSAGAWISAFSSESNYIGNVQTDITGHFKLSNVPNAQDIMITIQGDGYADAILKNQTATSNLRIILEQGGEISGCVSVKDNSDIPDIRITVQSQTTGVYRSTITSNDYCYVISGLNVFHNNVIITDYVVSVNASGYPIQSRGFRQVGDVVNFTLTRTQSNELSGVIRDKEGVLPPEWVSILIRLFEVTPTSTGGYLQKAIVDSEGQFTFTGLDPDKEYQLKLSTTGLDEDYIQWIGDDQGLNRLGATKYTTEVMIDWSIDRSWY